MTKDEYKHVYRLGVDGTMESYTLGVYSNLGFAFYDAFDEGVDLEIWKRVRDDVWEAHTDRYVYFIERHEVKQNASGNQRV